MEIRITGHKVSVTSAVKAHIEDRVLRYQKYTPRLVESHVIVKQQKYLYSVEITLLAKHFKAFGEGTSKDNLFAAIDQASERVEKQLKKYREKLKDHRVAKGLKAPVLVQPKESAAALKKKGKPAVIPTELFSSKPMTIEDASMHLHASHEPVVAFYNLGSKKLNVLFKRDDGHHGLVECE